MSRIWPAAAAFAILAFSTAALAQPAAPAPPSNLVASDHPWDNATRIDLTWQISPDDARLRGYVVRRRAASEQAFTVVDVVPPGTARFTVTNLSHEGAYVFQVAAVSPDNAESTPAATATPVTPTMEWFDGTRVWFLVTLIVLSAAVIVYIVLARRGMPLALRRIAGLEAVDDAVGRATEMGRSCLFVPGIGDMNDIQTIAGLTVLSRVAKTAAEYDARIEVPTSKSLVMTAAGETMQTAFLAAGRPEAFNPDTVYYVTDEQFGYVAYVQGYMVREKPAACFYMGSFFAESLLLAETGNSIGAIQIAGTAQPAQLPFFVAACDYTLIGEEFFAASAYLSGEPDQLGSLKGQDVGKLIVAAGILLGALGATAVEVTGSPVIESMVDFFTMTMLVEGASGMKRTIPLVITAAGGFVLIGAYFVPYTQNWGELAAIWFDVLAAVAFILGGANLLKSHLKRISDRVRGWGYSGVVVISFLLTLAVGLGKMGVDPSPQFPDYAWSGQYRQMGSAFWYLYQYVFTPLTATMFSLLAFYIASASFRAFRAKNLEASLLLGTAFIILLGRTFAGVALTSWIDPANWSGFEYLTGLRIENLTVYIMSVFNTAGNRAIMIGIALGIVSTSLKVLLGVDRSYLGKD